MKKYLKKLKIYLQFETIKRRKFSFSYGTRGSQLPVLGQIFSGEPVSIASDASYSKTVILRRVMDPHIKNRL